MGEKETLEVLFLKYLELLTKTAIEEREKIRAWLEEEEDD
jgi:hypothetical protein